jgi:hypothetical protein
MNGGAEKTCVELRKIPPNIAITKIRILEDIPIIRILPVSERSHSRILPWGLSKSQCTLLILQSTLIVFLF